MSFWGILLWFVHDHYHLFFFPRFLFSRSRVALVSRENPSLSHLKKKQKNHSTYLSIHFYHLAFFHISLGLSYNQCYTTPNFLTFCLRDAYFIFGKVGLLPLALLSHFPKFYFFFVFDLLKECSRISKSVSSIW